MTTIIGVNGERASHIAQWSSGPLGELIGTIIKFVDNDASQEGTGISIQIGDDIVIEDQNDGKGPTSHINGSNSPTQKKALVDALTSALEELGVSADDVRQTLIYLYSALTDTQNYDKEAVGDLLREKGLTLEMISKLLDYSGDAMIEELLNLCHVDPADYMTEEARAAHEAEMDALRAATRERRNPDPAPVEVAATPSTPLDLKTFFAMRGINYQEVMADGKFTYEDVKEKISKELFDVIANYMKVGDSDGEISEEDALRAIQVIQEYAAIMGISEAEAAEVYFSAASFRNEDFNTLRAVGENIAQELQGKNLSSKDALITTLQELGYSQEVIDAAAVMITNYNNVSAQFVASCLLRVAESARIGAGAFNINIDRSFPASIQYTASNVLAWLKGRGAVDDAEIMAEINEIFLPRNKGYRLQKALQYLYTLMTPENLAKAERAMELIISRARELGGEEASSTYHELLSLSSTSELHQKFAEVYLTVGQYADALSHAEQISETSTRNQIFATIAGKATEAGDLVTAFEATLKLATTEKDRYLMEILNQCMEDLNPTTLILAEKVIEEMSTGKELQYARLAAECLRNSDRAIQRNASAILGKIDPDYCFASAEELQALQTYINIGIELWAPGEQEPSIKAGALLTLVNEELMLATELRTMERDFIEYGTVTDPLTHENYAKLSRLKKSEAEAMAAISDLQRIIDDNSGGYSAYDKAYAHYLKGILLYLVASSHDPEDEIAFGERTPTAEQLLSESMWELRHAWEDAKAALADPENQAQTEVLNDLMAASFGRMVDICDAVRYSGPGLSSKKRKELAKKLAGFVPKENVGIYYVAHSTANAGERRNPLGYRSYIHAGNTDSYNGYTSALTGAVVNTGNSGNSGGGTHHTPPPIQDADDFLAAK